jgi:hypothetical protein
MMHKECIPILSRIGFHQYDNKETAKTLFDLERLKKWDKWDSKSLEFINSFQDDFSILRILTEYSKNVEDFNHWFIHQVTSALEDEFKELESYNRRFEQITLGKAEKPS